MKASKGLHGCSTTLPSIELSSFTLSESEKINDSYGPVHTKRKIKKQESIPVGCVAAVFLIAGGLPAEIPLR